MGLACLSKSYICINQFYQVRVIYLFLISFIITPFASCGGEEAAIEVPANILSKTKMAQVIKDIHLAEAKYNMGMLPDSSSNVTINFQQIFEKESVSKEQYDLSFAFYIEHPVLLNEVYEEVMNELSKMQGEASKQQ